MFNNEKIEKLTQENFEFSASRIDIGNVYVLVDSQARNIIVSIQFAYSPSSKGGRSKVFLVKDLQAF